MKAITALTTALLSVVATWAILSSVYRNQDPPTPIDVSAYPYLRPIAEFERSFGIGMSEQVLLMTSGFELMRAIADAEAKVYVFTTLARQKTIDTLLRTERPLGNLEQEALVKIQLEHEGLWIRDYLPVPVLKVYSHMTPIPSFVDFVYRDGNTFDDAAIHQFALAINSSVEHLPLVLDVGNFATNGESCVLSEEITEDPELLLQPTAMPSLLHLKESFKQALGCKQTFVVSQTPHPHVDMWMKFVSRDTLLINKIEPKALAKKLQPFERERVMRIAKALDETALKLSKSFRVVRIPMPMPVGEPFLTYANAILVNGSAIIPRYDKAKDGQYYIDRDLFPSYESTVETTFRRFGYKTAFINADELIKDGGAFHCVTFHLPDLDVIAKDRGYLAKRPKT